MGHARPRHANIVKPGLLTDTPFDAIGVGIGPSNLSVAALLSKCPDIRARFFDREPEFQWHRGLLLDGTMLQNSFLKDLVTPVDPTHSCSFLNFLHEQGRLYLFMNADFPRVLRAEFNDYLRWVCTKLTTLSFGISVKSIDFDGALFHIETDADTFVTARNLVVGLGVEPVVPAFCLPHLGRGVFHASEFLSRASSLRAKRVAVIGGGQTGAEVVLHLLRNAAEPPREITWISRRTNFLPLDESAFVNDMFTPTYSMHFARLPRDRRVDLLGEYRLASDGISPETILSIYQSIYQHRFLKQTDLRVRLLPGQELTSLVRVTADDVQLTLTEAGTNSEQEIDADAVVLCTGFAPHVDRLFTERLQSQLCYEGRTVAIGADYSARWKTERPGKLFILNAARSIRGIADPNLALLAWRASLVVNSLAGRTVYPDAQTHSMIEWAVEKTPDLAGSRR